MYTESISCIWVNVKQKNQWLILIWLIKKALYEKNVFCYIYIYKINNPTYYQKNKGEVLNKAEDYYQNDKERFREQASNKYQNLLEEKKQKLREQKRKKYRNLPEEKKQKLREQTRNKYRNLPEEEKIKRISKRISRSTKV